MTFDEYLATLTEQELEAMLAYVAGNEESISPRILRITWTNAPLPESNGATDVTLTYTVREGR